jgi:glycosyltransferase involved in cell wall biosynthesis
MSSAAASVSAPVRKAIARMNRAMGRYKSAGVPVSQDVHRLIKTANTARSDGNWERAAEFFAKAVDSQPGLGHIWIQLGHMHKELGNFDDASAAYAKAEALDPDQTEAAVHQGHIARMRNSGAEATRHYLRAYQRNRSDPDALRELLILAERGNGLSRESLMRALQGENVGSRTAPVRAARRGGGDVASLTALLERAGDLNLDADQIEALEEARRLVLRGVGPANDVDPATVSAVVFDASDLISYFGNARLPTGIQRVQIATIAGALDNRPEGSVKVCCFSDHGDSWAEVPIDNFLELSELSVISGDRTDPDWLDAYARLKLAIATAVPFQFPEGAFLVNLGTSWWLQNYFMFVREAKRLYNIRYVPFVHDFIPIMTPEHCVKQLTQDFISWALGVYQHADFFLVNSEATKRDLLKVAGILGHAVSADAVSVIPLNARFGSPEAKAAPTDKLRQWELRPGEFVLFVSTIESRKNHIGALEAWLDLVARHGVRKVPKLVCLGNRGWLNDAVYDKIAESPVLRERVVMLSGLSDEELALLYRTCRFTLYPSNYEGWGLPVTESLCYGKVPLVSDSSSLPEAGGDFAVYFKAGSTDEMTRKLEQLMFDDAELHRLEARIAADFHPRGWEDIANQIASEIEGFVARDGTGGAPGREVIEPIKMGLYYPLTRNLETRIWEGLSLAEIYRTGTGWWWADDWGCWTKPSGGELSFRFADRGAPLRGFVWLHAPPDAPSDFKLTCEEAGIHISGQMQAGEFRWIPFDLPADLPAEGIHMRVWGSHSVDVRERTSGLDPRVISLGVAGFYFCRADDLTARANFLEAVTLGALKGIAFNRELTR